MSVKDAGVKNAAQLPGDSEGRQQLPASRLAGSVSSSSFNGGCSDGSSSSLNSEQLAALSSSTGSSLSGGGGGRAESKSGLGGKGGESKAGLGGGGVGAESKSGGGGGAESKSGVGGGGAESKSGGGGGAESKSGGGGGAESKSGVGGGGAEGKSGIGGGGSNVYDDSSEVGSIDSSWSSHQHQVVFAYSPPKRVSGGGGSKPRAKASSGVKPAPASNSLQPPPPRPMVDRDGSAELPLPATTEKSNADGKGTASLTQQQPLRRRQRPPQSQPQPRSGSEGGRHDRARSGNASGRRPQRRQGGGDSSDNESTTSSSDDANVYRAKLRQAKTELKLMKAKAMQSERLRSRHGRQKTFNCSESYCDTQVIDFYIRKDTSRRYYPVSKCTTATLLDPWIDLAQQRPTERVRRVETRQRDEGGRSGEKADGRAASKRRSGSRTPLPFVAEIGPTAEYWRRPVSFVEVPEIRARIREAHAASGTRRRRLDFARTAEDCRSLQLDGLDRAVPGRKSRRSVARSCSAYMSGTPGSRAALNQCLDQVRGRSGHRWDSSSEGEGDGATTTDGANGGGCSASSRRQAIRAMARRSCAGSRRHHRRDGSGGGGRGGEH